MAYFCSLAGCLQLTELLPEPSPQIMCPTNMEYTGLKIHVNVAGIKCNWEAKSAVKRKQVTPSGVTYL